MTTIYSQQLHKLVSTVTSSLLLLRSGFQLRTFPFLSYQILTARAHNDSPSSPLTDHKIKNKVKVMLRPTVGPFILVSGTHTGPKTRFYFCQTIAGLLMWSALFNGTTGLSYTIAAVPRQRNHSRVRLLRKSWPYFTVWNSRLPRPGWPGPRIFIPREQGSPVIPPGTGFLFCHLLRLSKLPWRYTNLTSRVGPQILMILVKRTLAWTA
jgi:hypothetical protein